MACLLIMRGRRIGRGWVAVMAAVLVSVAVPVAGHAAVWTVHPTPPPPPGVVRGLSSVSCAARERCVAVGDAGDPGAPGTAFAEIDNGGFWHPLDVRLGPGDDGAGFDSVSCPEQNSCIAIGFNVFFPIAVVAVSARWDGSSWRQIPVENTRTHRPPNETLLSVSCATPTKCTAVGYGERGALIERLDGDLWRRQPPPDPDDVLYGVSCPATGSCTAVGPEGVIEQWDGQTWSIDNAPNESSGDLNSVSCITPQVCMAVGDTDGGASGSAPFAEQSGPGGWQVESPPSPARDIDSLSLGSVSCTDVRCVAVGSYQSQDGLIMPLIEVKPQSGPWHLVTPALPTDGADAPLPGVSCPTVLQCVAVGTSDQTPFVEVRSPRAGTRVSERPTGHSG